MLLLEIPHQSTLCLHLWTSPICIPLLLNPVHLAPPQSMQSSRPTLAFKPPILLPPTSLCTLLTLIVSLSLLLFLSPLTRSRSFPKVFEPQAPNYYTLSRLIVGILSVYRNPTLTHLPFTVSLDNLLCNLIVPIPSLSFFLLMTRNLTAVSSFLLDRVYPSMNFLPPLFLCLTTTLTT